MKRGSTGDLDVRTTGDETVRAFVPHALPPNPPLELGSALQASLAHAHLAIGRLDAVTTLLPEPHLFLYSYVRKEALLSSQIEGTQSSLSELLLFEIDDEPGTPIDDVLEVSNYVAALDHGLARLRSGFPLSNRLFREIHAKLLARGRGSDKSPGEFRRTQNWIGGTRPGNAQFVPATPERVEPCMADLERFLNDSDHETPAVLRAALGHAQFETIHPFVDGNGRVGRLLITLLLCEAGVLREPLLYLSLYLKQHRSEYYRLLNVVRDEGDWEAWIEFFLEGVTTTASSAVESVQMLASLFAEDHDRVRAIGRKAGSALRVHAELKQRPILRIQDAADRTKLSFPAAASAMESLAELGIVREITGNKRGRVFAYHQYMAKLSEGTESL